MASGERDKRGERLQIMLTADEIAAVDDWRFEHRMPSRSAAVRALMKLGIETAAAAPPAPAAPAGVSSADVGVLETDARADAALHPSQGPAVLVPGRASLAAHAMRSLLRDAGVEPRGPAETTERARELLAGDRVAAYVPVLDDDLGDADAFAAAVADSGLPGIVCAEKAPRSDLPEAFRGAQVISHLSAPEALPSALADVLGEALRPAS